MDARTSRGVTYTLSVSWVEIGYVMEKELMKKECGDGGGADNHTSHSLGEMKQQHLISRVGTLCAGWNFTLAILRAQNPTPNMQLLAAHSHRAGISGVSSFHVLHLDSFFVIAKVETDLYKRGAVGRKKETIVTGYIIDIQLNNIYVFLSVAITEKINYYIINANEHTLPQTLYSRLRGLDLETSRLTADDGLTRPPRRGARAVSRLNLQTHGQSSLAGFEPSRFEVDAHLTIESRGSRMYFIGNLIVCLLVHFDLFPALRVALIKGHLSAAFDLESVNS
ncbi:hypothetical protein EVAR_11851_1 [Eumeta japonica]|uniref:Uncharacterized protein n=1 Tax=Eumeta variegata TaxID=151549 RepID=A0A4C1U8W8_EUMVA|nr:hypothetical protein EVAR_11851_1 [Eumeta japonica]